MRRSALLFTPRDFGAEFLREALDDAGVQFFDDFVGERFFGVPVGEAVGEASEECGKDVYGHRGKSAADGARSRRIRSPEGFTCGGVGGGVLGARSLSAYNALVFLDFHGGSVILGV